MNYDTPKTDVTYIHDFNNLSLGKYDYKHNKDATHILNLINFIHKLFALFKVMTLVTFFTLLFIMPFFTESVFVY